MIEELGMDSATKGRGLSRWFSRFGLEDKPRFRLFCFPFAGANGAIYRLWPKSLPPRTEVYAVELPGRWQRRLDPVFLRMDPLVEVLARAIADLDDLPFAFYGHSSGALLAFELARELRRERLALPKLLMIGAHRAPDLPPTEPPLHRLSDPEFLVECNRRYNAIDERIVHDEELRQLVIPPMRADITVIETYEYYEEPPLECPLRVWGGRDDRSVSEASLRAWSRHGIAGAQFESLPGGHLFLKDTPESLLSRVRVALE